MKLKLQTMSTKRLARELGLIRKHSQSNAQKKLSRLEQMFSYLIVIDFESTCWREKNNYGQEIIEFPAVLLNTTSGEIESEFHSYVQPQEHPVLSEFCTELTGITQKQVEAGLPLRICLSRFSRWLHTLQQEKGVMCVTDPTHKPASAHLCTFLTWSDWDLGVCLLYECKRKQISKPEALNNWIDLRATYRMFYSRKPKGLNGALQDLGIQFSGRQHSGLDDARNTAALAWRMMTDGCLLKVTKSLNRAPLKVLPLFKKPQVHNEGQTTHSGNHSNESGNSTTRSSHSGNHSSESGNSTTRSSHSGNHSNESGNSITRPSHSGNHNNGSGNSTTRSSHSGNHSNESGDITSHSSVCQSLVATRTVLGCFNTLVCVNNNTTTATTTTLPNTAHTSPSHHSETDSDWSEGFLVTEPGESGSYDDMLLEDEDADLLPSNALTTSTCQSDHSDNKNRPGPSKPRPSSSTFVSLTDPYRSLIRPGQLSTTTPSMPFTIYTDQSHQTSSNVASEGMFKVPHSIISSHINQSKRSSMFINQSDHSFISMNQSKRSSISNINDQSKHSSTSNNQLKLSSTSNNQSDHASVPMNQSKHSSTSYIQSALSSVSINQSASFSCSENQSKRSSTSNIQSKLSSNSINQSKLSNFTNWSALQSCSTNQSALSSISINQSASFSCSENQSRTSSTVNQTSHSSFNTNQSKRSTVFINQSSCSSNQSALQSRSINQSSLSSISTNQSKLSSTGKIQSKLYSTSIKQSARSSTSNNQSALQSRSINQSAVSSTSTNQSAVSVLCSKVSKVTAPVCACGRRAKRLTVCNGGPNQGRPFYTCPIRKRTSDPAHKSGCGFFKWESAVINSVMKPNRSFSFSTTASRNFR